MPPLAESSKDPNSGVLLFNLGGPETLEDVRPFLFNLFSDPDIIRIKNRLLRHTLAWLIASTRQGKSRDLYRQIGGGSPLRKITEGQAAALQARLEARGLSARVYVGMRCWKPSIDEAVARLARDNIDRLVVLPLFPQFSLTTTGSCFNYFKQLVARMQLATRMEISYIDTWFDEPRYIESMVDLIEQAIHEFPDKGLKGIHLLYSAHSIPARYVTEGDPYPDQTEKTVSLINSRLGHAFPSFLAFQSKVGPVKWLEPSTNKVLADLARRGTKKVLVVPISFVSDHVETLQEIDILYRKLATDAGIREFRRVPALNLYPKFIDALADLVVRGFQNQPPRR